MARFAGTLSTLLSSGVPVLESLDITADTAGNEVVADGRAGHRRGGQAGRAHDPAAGRAIRCSRPWSSR